MGETLTTHGAGLHEFILRCSKTSLVFFIMYNARHPRADNVSKKIRRGPLVRNPRRRDIAPTGELAGLPARDAPKSSEDMTPAPIGGEAVRNLN